MSAKLKKPPSEMTAEELAKECERITGLPTPSRNATPEEHNQWYVAACFIIYHRGINDAVIANRMAVEAIKRQSNCADYLPYIEQVIGSVAEFV